MPKVNFCTCLARKVKSNLFIKVARLQKKSVESHKEKGTQRIHFWVLKKEKAYLFDLGGTVIRERGKSQRHGKERP